jgi:hypothetical protein
MGSTELMKPPLDCFADVPHAFVGKVDAAGKKIDI